MRFVNSDKGEWKEGRWIRRGAGGGGRVTNSDPRRRPFSCSRTPLCSQVNRFQAFPRALYTVQKTIPKTVFNHGCAIMATSDRFVNTYTTCATIVLSPGHGMSKDHKSKKSRQLNKRKSGRVLRTCRQCTRTPPPSLCPHLPLALFLPLPSACLRLRAPPG